MYVCVFNSGLTLKKWQLKTESNCKFCENSKWQLHKSSTLKVNLERAVITTVEETTGGYWHAGLTLSILFISSSF